MARFTRLPPNPLKTHSIDLKENQLVFNSASGVINAPFLHEFQLPQEKGGSMGFDADASNAELLSREIEHDEKKRSRTLSGEGKEGEEKEVEEKVEGGDGMEVDNKA